MTARNLLIVSWVAALTVTIWWAAHSPHSPPSWDGGLVGGLTYAPYQRHDDPARRDVPSREDVYRDVDLIAGRAGAIRTYAMDAAGARAVAAAAAYNLRITAGAWLRGARDADRAEIEHLIAVANRTSAIERLLIGNETVLHERLAPRELAALIGNVRQTASVPVGTAEPWHIWLAHPELAAASDFVGVHILPYWEGISRTAAIDYVFRRLAALRTAFPGKPIVLAEVGWPSDGPRMGAAVPSIANQAWFSRAFATRAEKEGFSDYFFIEAFDQPWKSASEGQVGPYWGLWNANRQPKFPWVGSVTPRPSWWLPTMVVVLGLLIVAGVYLRARPQISSTGTAAMSFFVVGSFSLYALTASAPLVRYYTGAEIAVWSVLLAAQLLLIATALVEAIEALDVTCTGPRRRIFAANPGVVARHPMVSIHVPCCDEPPDMVAQTLRALGRLDYPAYEVLVIVNNTPDPENRRAISDLCRRFGPKFRFICLPDCPGYKAGALNVALSRSHAAAEIVAVVDSDYTVDPHWLSAAVPHFTAPDVAIVQAPQDYRDRLRSVFKRLCFWEYAAFFKIGMVQRNEANAIIQHGTMTLIRRRALQDVGGWNGWCITEDAELGLRLMAAGWRSAFITRSLGRGLTPDRFESYKAQRFRWVYGAMQVLKHHAGALFLGRETQLSVSQRYHFVAGWLPWLADGCGLLFTVGAIAWSAALALWPDAIMAPAAVFLLPTVAVFLFRQARVLWLYRRTMGCRFVQAAGASIAGLGLSHTVGKGVLWGLFTRQRPFLRTPKCEDRPGLLNLVAGVGEEAVIFLALAGSIAAVALQQGLDNIDVRLWLLVLTIQTIPYAAAIALAVLSGRPIQVGQQMAAPIVVEPAE